MAPSQTEEYDLAVATYREAVETLRPADLVEPKSKDINATLSPPIVSHLGGNILFGNPSPAYAMTRGPSLTPRNLT
jgi:hypothetical protein